MSNTTHHPLPALHRRALDANVQRLARAAVQLRLRDDAQAEADFNCALAAVTGQHSRAVRTRSQLKIAAIRAGGAA